MDSVAGPAVAAVSKVVWAAVKEAGFRRQGNHLWRQSDDVFHGVHFQNSHSYAASFTVNLVVAVPSLYEYMIGKPFPANPATALFPIMQRIGLVMPTHRDYWWSVSQGTNLPDLAANVMQAVKEYGLPFLDQYPNTEVMLEEMRASGELRGLLAPGAIPLVHAMLAKERGELEEASKQLRRAFDEFGHPIFRETVGRVAGRLGLSQVLLECP